MTLSEEKGNTHTHSHLCMWTHSWFLLLLHLHLPLSRQRVFGESWQEVCMCVCVCVCVLFILRLARQTEPGSSAKVKTRGSSFTDRQERQKVRQRVLSGFCFFHLLLAFWQMLKLTRAFLAPRSNSPLPTNSWHFCPSSLQTVETFTYLQALNKRWHCTDSKREGLTYWLLKG